MTFRSTLCTSALTLLTTLASIACQDSSGDTKNAADGGATTSPATSTTESTPQGYFFGPVGAEVGLSIGQESLTSQITAPNPPAAYSQATFQLKSALDAAASYDVTLGSTPNGQICKVYSGASGTGAELSADGAVRIGCEWGFDLLGRSSDDAVQAYSNNSTGVVIGGSARTIGSSPATGDGRYVAFRAGQEGLAPGSSSARSIYWRDRRTGETRLVSHAPDGTPANADCWQPAISADGLKVAFYSSASNLVANDTNGENDVFVWSSANGSVTRVSVGPNGEEADSASQDPALSGDGHVVAFLTNATTVAPTANDSTLAEKVVRIDLASGKRTVVTRNKSTGNPTDGAWPMLSEDGDRLVFWAYRDVTGDLNSNLWDVFVYEHSSGRQWPVSQGKTGENRNQGSDSTSGVIRPAISGDGKWVTYGTTATNVVPDVTDKLSHVFLVEADQCSASGCNVVVVDRANGVLADTAAASAYAPLSYDGRWLAFTSDASNLGVTNDGRTNAFLYDRTTTTLTPLTKVGDGYGGTYGDAAISPDGAYATLGAYVKYDPRFQTDGIFAAYTSLSNAFSWQTGPLN